MNQTCYDCILTSHGASTCSAVASSESEIGSVNFSLSCQAKNKPSKSLFSFKTLIIATLVRRAAGVGSLSVAVSSGNIIYFARIIGIENIQIATFFTGNFTIKNFSENHPL